MIQEDFYTGEPVNTGSPPNFQNPNIINTGSSAEIEAANMASFGKYDYDPGTRNIMTAPVPMGGYGGTFNPYQQPQMMGGIGAPPIGYYSGYSMYGNPQPTYGQFRPGGFGPYYQQPQQQMPQQPTTIHIPGVNFSGEFMPPADYQERISQIQMEYFQRQQEIEAKQTLWTSLCSWS